MENNSKHNDPMSADELFRRLEQSKAEDSGELDDFEKEALEGFAMLNNPAEARSAYDHVLSELSKKTASKSESSGRSRGIIWFSAAAGLIIIIGLIGLWFNAEKKVNPNNMAMNTESHEVKEPVPMVPAKETESKPNEPFKQSIGAVTDTKVSSGPTLPIQDQILAREKQVVVDEEQQEGLYKTATDKSDIDKRYRYETDQDTKSSSNETQVPAEAKAEEQKLSEVTGKTDGVANGTYTWASSSANTQPVIAATGSAVSQEAAEGPGKKKLGKEKTRKYTNKDEAGSVAANKNATRSAQPVNNNTVGGVYDAPDLNNSNQKVLETPATVVVTSKEATAISGDDNLQADGKKQEQTKNADPGHEAYYPGGDKAVKAFLVKKVAELNKSIVLKGTYQIIATVKADGTLTVDKIINTSGDCATCVPELQKALNAMKGWKAATADGETKPSALMMTLTF